MTYAIENLKEEVVKQLGYFGTTCRTEAEQGEMLDTLRVVTELGASGGFAGFTYYRDTGKFYAENAKAIWDLLNDDAEDMGVSPIQLVANFTESHSVTDQTTLENLLVWYALERVASVIYEES